MKGEFTLLMWCVSLIWLFKYARENLHCCRNVMCDLSGEHWKTRQRKLKSKAKEKITLDAVSCRDTEESNCLLGSDFAVFSQSTQSPVTSATKKDKGPAEQTQETCMSFEPVHSSSHSILSDISSAPPGRKEIGRESTECINHLKVFDNIFSHTYTISLSVIHSVTCCFAAIRCIFTMPQDIM